MTDLRKAAEMALEALLQTKLEDVLVEVEPNVWEYKGTVAIQALRQALAKPKRKWVGLTDYEIESELTKEFGQWWSRHVSVCRAIEAKLKEKNNG